MKSENEILKDRINKLEKLVNHLCKQLALQNNTLRSLNAKVNNLEHTTTVLGSRK